MEQLHPPGHQPPQRRQPRTAFGRARQRAGRTLAHVGRGAVLGILDGAPVVGPVLSALTSRVKIEPGHLPTRIVVSQSTMVLCLAVAVAYLSGKMDAESVARILHLLFIP